MPYTNFQVSNLSVVMSKYNSLSQVDRNYLANPKHGQAYLKAALEMGDEQEFLSALRAVMDSLIDSEFQDSLRNAAPA